MLSKPIPSIHILLGLMAAAGLVACAAPGDSQDHTQHHPEQSANMTASGSSGTSATQSGTMCGNMAAGQGGCGMMGDSKMAGPGGMQHMDKDAMCAMYRSMRDAPTDQARQAMMDRQMQGMSPEMRQQHMEMMRQQCP